MQILELRVSLAGLHTNGSILIACSTPEPTDFQGNQPAAFPLGLVLHVQLAQPGVNLVSDCGAAALTAGSAAVGLNEKRVPCGVLVGDDDEESLMHISPQQHLGNCVKRLGFGQFLSRDTGGSLALLNEIERRRLVHHSADPDYVVHIVPVEPIGGSYEDVVLAVLFKLMETQELRPSRLPSVPFGKLEVGLKEGWQAYVAPCVDIERPPKLAGQVSQFYDWNIGGQ